MNWARIIAGCGQLVAAGLLFWLFPPAAPAAAGLVAAGAATLANTKNDRHIRRIVSEMATATQKPGLRDRVFTPPPGSARAPTPPVK